eukprot:754483-Hanusia_phi.AAC.2
MKTGLQFLLHHRLLNPAAMPAVKSASGGPPCTCSCRIALLLRSRMTSLKLSASSSSMSRICGEITLPGGGRGSRSRATQGGRAGLTDRLSSVSPRGTGAEEAPP